MTDGFQISGGSIIREIDRLDDDTIALFRSLPSSIVSDCLDRLQVMRPEIKPMSSRRAFLGSALTVEEVEGGNLMSHLALKYVQPGDVLVIDAKEVETRAAWGGLQTCAAQQQGVAAVVIDGAIRDVADTEKHDIPVYARGVTPAGPHKGWGGRINAPISCGGVVVAPGDLILGDDDGIVVVPRDQAEAVAMLAKEKIATEDEWFAKVERGELPADFLGLTEKIESYNIRVQ